MKIQEYLDDKELNTELKSLIAFHTTDFKSFELIGESNLTPTNCRVFNDELLYLFYGRSSYSKYSNGQVSLEDNLFAASMGIGQNDLNEDGIYKVFPFDSGAFYDDRFKPHISKMENVNDYLIPKEAINLYIQEFFGNELNYLDGISKKFDCDNLDEKILKLNALLSDRSHSNFDTRARTIEILYKNVIPLDQIKILVIHERFQNKEVVKKLAKSPSLKILTYDTDETGNESDIYTLIRSKIKEYMKEYLREII